MRSVVFVARLQLVRRLRSLVVITIVIGVFGGIAVSLIAGARRSTSVVDRYFSRTIRYDLTVFAPGFSRSLMLSMPGVTRADPNTYLGILWRAPDGSRIGSINGQGMNVESMDATFEVLAGQLPTESDPLSVVVNPSFVKQFDARVGQIVDGQMFAQADEQKTKVGDFSPTGRQFQFHIVGVVRTPNDIALDESHFVAHSAYGATSVMLVPISFYDAHRKDFLDFGVSYNIQLVDGQRDRARFEAAVKASNPPPGMPIGYDVPRFSERRASLETPVNLESTFLLALGIAVGVAGAIVVALLLRADQRGWSRDDPALRAIGSTRAQLGAIAALRAAPVALVGAGLTVAVAYASSGRYPIGVGGRLEPARGLEVNLAVFALAALIVMMVVTSCAFAFGLGGAPRRVRPARRGWVTHWLARSGAPNDCVVGTNLAFERGGQSGSMPSRQAVFGGAAALAVIVGIAVFVTGVDDLYSRPAAHGWPWDLAIGNVNVTMPNATLHRLAADSRLEAQTKIRYGQATLRGRSVEVLAFDPAGSAPPVMLSGRLPASATEIALGDRLLHQLRLGIGSTVKLSVAETEFDGGTGHSTDVDLTVVGVAIPPIFGESDLGEVGVVTLDAIRAAGGNDGPQLVLALLRGSDHAATIAALDRDYVPEMQADFVPARVVNLHRVRVLPLLGIALAGALGIVLLAYTLAIGLRAHTRDLGVLRALGMSTRRVGAVLAWQGAVLAVAIVAIGIPIGLLVGSVAWRTVAHQLGVGDRPAYSVWIVVHAALALLVGLACSVLPARRARRGAVGALLRVE